MWLLLLLSLWAVPASYQTELFSVQSGSDYAVEAICEKDKGETCELVDFKLENLIEIMTKQEKEFTIPKSVEKEEMTFKLKTKKRTAQNYFFTVFETEDGSEAEFTVNPKNMSITGIMRIGDKKGSFDTYTITHCGENCHKMQKFTKESKSNEGEDAIDLHELVGEGEGSDYGGEGDDIETVKAGFAKPNNRNVAITTITFYVTPEFLEQYKDPYGIISLLINQANKGYKANKLPIELRLHCIKKAPFSENDPKWVDGEGWQKADGKKTQLFAFANLDTPENKWNDLRVSADMAYLLLAGSGSKVSGESILLPYGKFDGATLGFVYTSPAMTAFSLDHEIAHLYGCWHDDRTKNKYLEYGYGFQIARGYRTIMAYSAPGHEQRIQHYSSSQIEGNTPKGDSVTIGDRDKHDNRRIMMERRFQIAETGDESMKCPGDLMPQLIRQNGGGKGKFPGGKKGKGGGGPFMGGKGKKRGLFRRRRRRRF